MFPTFNGVILSVNDDEMIYTVRREADGVEVTMPFAKAAKGIIQAGRKVLLGYDEEGCFLSSLLA